MPAGDLLSHLQSLGLNAQPGTDQPVSAELQLLVVNGADATYPNTLAMLRATLGVTGPMTADGTTPVRSVTEPGEAVGFVIVTGPVAGTPSATAGP